MNKFVLSLLLAVGLAGTAQAQMRVGIKAGANMAQYTNVDLTGHGFVIGPQAGFTLNAPITSDGFFSVQPELLYSQKGDKIEDLTTSRLHYVDLPVLARINADGFIFEAGPQVGFLAAGTHKQYQRINGQTTDSRTFSSTDGLHRFDVGYVAGVGYQLASGPNIGLRYNGGLTRLLDNGSTVSVRNSVFQLFVGYVFGAKK